MSSSDDIDRVTNQTEGEVASRKLFAILCEEMQNRGWTVAEQYNERGTVVTAFGVDMYITMPMYVLDPDHPVSGYSPIIVVVKDRMKPWMKRSGQVHFGRRSDGSWDVTGAAIRFSEMARKAEAAFREYDEGVKLERALEQLMERELKGRPLPTGVEVKRLSDGRYRLNVTDAEVTLPTLKTLLEILGQQRAR